MQLGRNDAYCGFFSPNTAVKKVPALMFNLCFSCLSSGLVNKTRGSPILGFEQVLLPCLPFGQTISIAFVTEVVCKCGERCCFIFKKI